MQTKNWFVWKCANENLSIF